MILIHTLLITLCIVPDPVLEIRPECLQSNNNKTSFSENYLLFILVQRSHDDHTVEQFFSYLSPESSTAHIVCE